VKNRSPLTVLIGACLLVVMVFVAACSSGENPQPTPTNGTTTTPTAGGNAPKVIKIGGAVPLTGTSASGGVDLFFGYNQAVRDINAQGGVYVKAYDAKIPLQLTVLDDESDPTKTVARLEKLASVDKVSVYLGSYSSELNAAAAAIAEKNKIPMVAIAFSNLAPHEQGYKYLFSPFVKTPTGVDAIFQLFNGLGTKKPTKIGIWAEQTDWGVELAKYVPEYAKKYGYQVVMNQNYDITTIDFSSLILAAKTAGVEVVIAVPTPAAAITMAKQMKELDYNPQAYVFWRGAGAASWPKTMGKDGDYALYVANWDWHYNTPGTKELVDVYRAANGTMPSVNIGGAYAAVQVVADAITRAGSLDPAKIREALAATKDLQTVEGLIKGFEADGAGVLPCAIMQWQSSISQVVYNPGNTSAQFVYPMKKFNDR
jgi:branched-chain amino acid transport system substrate-binding protein